MGNVDALARVVDVYAWQRANVETRVALQVRRTLMRFAGWYSPEQVAQMADVIGVQVAAGQRSVAGLTDTYMARMAREVFGESFAAVGVPAWMGNTLRLNVSGHVEVYSRLGVEFRRQMAADGDASGALSATLSRADAMVSTDLGLAARDQSSRFMERRGVQRYRRVIRPEVSKSGTCGLCLVAADRVYRRSSLLPLHARCKCVVVAVTDADPGKSLNAGSLSAVYSAVGSTSADALKRTRVQVVQHSELGPQLRVADQNFRGPDQLAA